jgi:hypothetical protein
MFSRARSLAIGLVGLTLILGSGCGDDCGDNTVLKDGVCEAIKVTCGPGTVQDGGGCYPVPQPDMPAPHDTTPPPDAPSTADAVSADACLGASMCATGTRFRSDNCTCIDDKLPPLVAVTDVKDRLIANAVNPTFVKEGGGLFLYWTTFGTPLPGQTDPFAAAKQEIDPATLTLMGNPQLVTELGPRVLSPSASPDGLWLIWSCQRSDHGLAARNENDMCVAKRADTNSPWGNIRVLEEIALFGSSGLGSAAPQAANSPTFLADANGSPTHVYFSAVNEAIEGGSLDICIGTFDTTTSVATSAQGDPTMGTVLCDAMQFFDSMPPAGMITISESSGSETGPSWSADGKFFSWTKSGGSGFVTQNADIWLGMSSQANGVVDMFCGGLGINDDLNQLELAFAPDTSNAVAWTVIPDLNDTTQGLFVSVGHLNGCTLIQ